MSPADAVISHVVALKAEAEPAAAAGAEGAPAAAAEPEVIKKGKKEEEGAVRPPRRKEEGREEGQEIVAWSSFLLWAWEIRARSTKIRRIIWVSW